VGGKRCGGRQAVSCACTAAASIRYSSSGVMVDVGAAGVVCVVIRTSLRPRGGGAPETARVAYRQGDPRVRAAWYDWEVAVNSRELAGSLRTWRDRVSPADAGLSTGPRRRVPGLRRQEVAELAGLSVEYLARLEQGRAGQRSDAVLASLARVLRLSDQERAHLFRLAGQAEPLSGQIKRHVTPSVQRILDRLTDTPVTVVDASWRSEEHTSELQS